MHEMAVTQGLLNMALEHAAGRRITDIYLQVGRMSPVVPSSVALFFDHLSQGTLAEGRQAALRYHARGDDAAPIAVSRPT